MTILEHAARALLAETGPVEVSATAVIPVRAVALAELARAVACERARREALSVLHTLPYEDAMTVVGELLAENRRRELDPPKAGPTP